MSPEKAFTQQQKDAMVAAIKQAEKDTSGEIRVHIENRSKIDVLDRAADVFAHLNMHKTAQRNGVLIYATTNPRSLEMPGLMPKYPRTSGIQS